MSCKNIEKVINKFDIEGDLVSFKSYGQGHINSTFLVVKKTNNVEKKYIIQKINISIFKDPIGLMQNIFKVTEFLKEKIIKAGGNPERETLTLIRTLDNDIYFKDDFGDYWRGYYFIEDTISYDIVDNPDTFTEIGFGFGNFQKQLLDFPIETLVDTIPNFHNVGLRIKRLKEVIKLDPLKRAGNLKAEIDFVLAREKEADYCLDLQKSGELPTKVAHNDTKINNILVDKDTKKSVCVIDLDTVMPGLSAYDFGDAIRTGASTAIEDEADLSKVSLSLELFESYTKGFLKGVGESLTEKEIDVLPMGAKLITFVMGIRFLTDYIEGDVYYKINSESHNIDRARNQIALVKDIEIKFNDMKSIVEKYK